MQGPTPSEVPPSEPTRLHWASLVISLIYDIRKAGVALLGIIPAFLFARSDVLGFLGVFLPLVLTAMAVLLVLSPIVKWLRTTYHVEGNTLIIEGGFISRWRRVIPRPRIQSVDMVQKLRHQIFGVMEVRVEAIGGSETEAALYALDPQAARALRRWALSGGHEEEAGGPLVRLTPRDLVIAGVTGGRVAVFAVLFGYVFELLPEEYLDDVFEGVAAWAESALFAAILAGVAVLLASFVVSVAATVLIYWEFTVVRQGDRLVITRGLLEKRHATVPLPRVQAVFLQENLLRRVLGLASLKVHVAGYAGDKKEVEESSMLLPVGSRESALRLAGEVYRVPWEVLEGSLETPPARAVITRMFFGAFSGMTVAAAAIGLLGPRALWGLLATVPIGLGVGYLRYRSLGHAVLEDWAVTRQGVLVRTTAFVRRSNIQHIGLTAHPLQRMLHLGSLRLSIPRGAATAVDLDRGVGESVFGRLASGLTGGTAL